MEATKACNKCKRELPADLEHFHKDSKRVSGLGYTCHECRGHEFRIIPQEGYKVCKGCKGIFPKNKEYFAVHHGDILRSTCIQCNRNYMQKIRNKQPDRNKLWYVKNRESQLLKFKEYRERNLDEIKARDNAYVKSRLETDVNYRLLFNLRRRLHHALGSSKQYKTIELVGCDTNTLMKHLASQFKRGMAWASYGKYWVIDHKRPCASFDLSDPKQQKECFHYTNLQPLTKSDNYKKSSWHNGVLYRPKNHI